MSEDLIEEYRNVLIEDLQAYMNGLDDKNFGFCNIISNRLVTDAIVLKSKEYMLLGAILKEVIYDFRLLQDDKQINIYSNTLKAFIRKYLSKERDFNAIEIVDDYYNFFYESREIIVSDSEKYQENPDFSMLTTRYCLDFLKKELTNQDLPYNLDVLVFGVTTEINRVMKFLGCIPQQLILRISLSFFGRLYDYFRLILASENNKSKWKELYLKYKTKLISNIDKFSTESSYIITTTDLIYEFCEEWRFMFMRLLELPRTSIIEKPITIPKIIREELNEFVSNLISSKLEEKEK